MWWRPLPTFAITVGLITGIPLGHCAVNYIFTGNLYLRHTITPDECLHYLRDKRLSGGVSAYNQVGLENIKEF